VSFASRVVKGALRAVRQRLLPPPVIQLVREEHARVLDNQLLLDKNVLVTGAGRNIGRSIALEMARQGANVYFTDLQPEIVSDLQSELEAGGARARGFVSDIGAPAGVDGLSAALDSDGVIIDVLVNNVGVHQAGGLRKLTRTDWREVFETNVFGPVQLTQYVVDRLVAAGRPGSVLFITSVHEQSTLGAVAYSATKSALAMIVKELAFELAPHRIRVNAIAPGAVAVIESDTLPPFPGSALFGACIHPSYIGRAAVYLAADYFSQFTTGSTVTVDAGLLARPQIR
jgi:NAD(P)-dependent dehydrogenase (short-subunit alcohol dehydrogenase family)